MKRLGSPLELLLEEELLEELLDDELLEELLLDDELLEEELLEELLLDEDELELLLEDELLDELLSVPSVSSDPPHPANPKLIASANAVLNAAFVFMLLSQCLLF